MPKKLIKNDPEPFPLEESLITSKFSLMKRQFLIAELKIKFVSYFVFDHLIVFK